jgi:hypothetical protein
VDERSESEKISDFRVASVASLRKSLIFEGGRGVKPPVIGIVKHDFYRSPETTQFYIPPYPYHPPEEIQMTDDNGGNFWLGVIAGWIVAALTNGIFPLIGPIIGGFVAGFIARGGTWNGAIAGLLSGILGSLVAAIIILIGGTFLLGGLGFLAGLGAGLVLVFFALWGGILGAVGGGIAGLLRK